MQDVYDHESGRDELGFHHETAIVTLELKLPSDLVAEAEAMPRDVYNNLLEIADPEVWIWPPRSTATAKNKGRNVKVVNSRPW